MEFSGERFMDVIDGQIRYEHFHRYGWCLSLVTGLDVLDLACGAGYGSAILASRAKSVTGIDISHEAVAWASERYAQKNNLSFMQASAIATGLADASVDVVVSFETIEHLTEQEEMLSEIRRVLKPDGLLIMSSPNRDVYSVKLNQNNPFHVKEMDFSEFDALLHRDFDNVEYYAQRITGASFVYPLDSFSGNSTAESIVDTGDDLQWRQAKFVDPVYFIAVATSGARSLPKMPYSTFTAENDPITRELLDLSDAVSERDGRLSQLYHAIERLEADMAALVQDRDRLERDNVGRRENVLDLENRLLKLTEECRRLSDDVVERDGRLAQLYPAVTRLEELFAQSATERDLLDKLVSDVTSEKVSLAEDLDASKARENSLALTIASLGGELEDLRAKLRDMEEVKVQSMRFERLFAAKRAQYNALATVHRRLPTIVRRLVGGAGLLPVLREASHSSDPASIHDIDHLKTSGLVDLKWYSSSYGVAQSDAVEHYYYDGWREGKNPNRIFDNDSYLARYRDVYSLGINPLVHYVLYGEAEGRAVSERFDATWYARHNPDVVQSGMGLLRHYLSYGEAEGRRGSSLSPVEFEEIKAGLPAELQVYFEPLGDYDSWVSVNDRTARSVGDVRQQLALREGKLPTISFITPVYNTPEPLLRELVESVLGQVYGDWELCLADDASTDHHVGGLLDELASLDPRIRVLRCEENGGISAATNAAVEIASGEIIAFLDHDDLITWDCAAELAIYYADHPDADIVYSDDDKIDLKGNRFAPQFKPDWSPTLLLNYMYFSHVFSVKRALFTSLGGFRKLFDGSQDYDFALRATEKARHVGHIPRVLYHWRVVPGSTAASGDAKPESFAAGRLAITEALERREVAAVVSHPEWAQKAKVGMFGLTFPDDGPEITIVIPTYNQKALLEVCIESLRNTTYRNYQVLVIDNESNEADILEYLKDIEKRPRFRVIKIPKNNGKFSFAGLMNAAVAFVDTPYILFLNNDVKVIEPRWLSQMVGHAKMPGVGAVGARLYFADDTIQHAGIVHGYHEGLVGHAFRNAPPHDWGYMGFVRTSREYSAVTAACMLTPKALFEELGGFDEINFSVAYNDVDYGYRVVKAGLRCVYCADAQLYHFEGKTRPKKDDPREVIALRRIYGDWVDRYYNPNLSLEDEKFRPAAVRLPLRSDGVRTIAFFSHNLNFEGAPNTLLDLIAGLVRDGKHEAVLFTPVDGPLRAAYEKLGIKIVVFDPPALHGDQAEYTRGVTQLGDLILRERVDMVVANTLNMFFAINAATQVNLASIWCQHESEPWRTYFDYLSIAVRGYAYAAFGQAYRVTYVADSTRQAWSEMCTRQNFQVIRHGIPEDRMQEELNKWTRPAARQHLEIDDGDIAIIVTGTVCERKGQQDLVRAYAELSDEMAARCRIFIVGAFGEAHYTEALREDIRSLPESRVSRVTLTGPVDDITVFYKASDIFTCCSRIESAPRVIVEAMAFGVPIITTPVFGIPELVDQGVNAEFYDPGDIRSLARLMEALIENEDMRLRMAQRSPEVLASRKGYAEMLKDYELAISQAIASR